MSQRKDIPVTCDWREKPLQGGKAPKENKTKLYTYKSSFTWKDIRTEKYKSSGKGWADIIRQTLIGNHGESAKFQLRYFELAPNGFSSFEKHRHEHVVIGIRGQGTCIVEKKKYRISFLDTLYIKPNETHQLKNPYNEPFGFFCIVNAKRDKPKIIGP